MSVQAITQQEASGVGLGPEHGPALDRINAAIALANKNEKGTLNIVDAVLTVADAPGGATDSALTCQLNDVDGVAIKKAAVVKIVAADTEYAGSNDTNATTTFGTATTGSILASGNGWAVVKTDATGAFACTATNSADETVYFSAATVDGGVDALASGVLVRGCLPESATWSA